jgi:hypothetical protein
LRFRDAGEAAGRESVTEGAEVAMYKLVCALMLWMPGAFAADVSGTWQLAVETNQGAGAPTMVLEQKGERVTGTFKSQILGEVKLSGTVKGNAIEFGFTGEAGGQSIKVTYKGTVEGATKMKGTAVYEGVDDRATWTAEKK